MPNSTDDGQIRQETYFAPAARASKKALQQGIEVVTNHPIIDAVMAAVPGLLAVLDEHRQILAVNDVVLQMLGLKNAKDLLGLRPGEALNCIHAHDHPGGCGTGRACVTCAAAIAIVASLTSNRPEQRDCCITTQRCGEQVDLFFQVRCCPVVFSGQRFLLLFLRDVTIEQQRAGLEHAFFHDLNNIIMGLLTNSQLLGLQGNMPGMRKFAERIWSLSSRLASEVEIQRALSHSEPAAFQVSFQDVPVARIIQDLAEGFSNHPVAQERVLVLPEGVSPDLTLRVDQPLLLRIVTNMLMNAFEATPTGGTIRLWIEQDDRVVTFCVWNQQPIAEDIALRVFQRNFSTKAGSGRGLGTYAMKVFGEGYLRGKVSFTSSPEKGTVFRFSLPT